MGQRPDWRYSQPQEIAAWHELKPSLKQLGIRWRTGAEFHARLLNHWSAKQTDGGLWYYQTLRNRDETNKVYLLWQGQTIEQIKTEMAALKFMFDHLPNIEWWIISPQLNSGGYRTL